MPSVLQRTHSHTQLIIRCSLRCVGRASGPCSGEQLSAACDTCIEIYHSLSHWFTSCVARQQRPSKDLNSFLVTDIR